MMQDPIDQMFSFTLNGVAFAIEIVGKITPEILHFFAKLKHEGLKKEGEVNYYNLLTRGNGLEALNLREQDLDLFKDSAKGSGLIYAVATLDKVNKPGERTMTIYFSPADATIVNQIIEVNNLNTVKAGSAKLEEAGELDIPMPDDKDEPLPPDVPGDDDWLEFFGPSGEYGTPEENKALDEDHTHLDPTVPESRNEFLSQNSSGPSENKKKKQSDRTPIQGEETLRPYNGEPTQAKGAATPGANTVGTDGRIPIKTQLEMVHQQKQAKEEKAQELPGKNKTESKGETFKEFANRILDDGER